MGEVISIKRSNDDDLFDYFQKACPTVPADADDIISQSAARALGGEQLKSMKPTFRSICLVVGGVCLVGLLLAKGVATRWNNAVDSAARSTVTSNFPQAEANRAAMANTMLPSSASDPTPLAAATPAAINASGNSNLNSDKSWQRSRAAWAEYIARLESDPFYQYVEQEKRRFESRYPD